MQAKPWENVRRFLALAAFGALGFASLLEQGFGYEPCALCKVQRIPWWMLLGLCLIALPPLIHFRPPIRLFPAFAFLLLLAAAGTGAFHFAVEQGWVIWESACTSSEDFSFSDFQEFLASGSQPVVSCLDPAIVVLGLSLAGWNAIFSLLLAGWVMTLMFWRHRR